MLDRVTELMKRDIDAMDLSRLRQGCGLKEASEDGQPIDLPIGVVREYWSYKIFRDRMNSSLISDDAIAMICRLGAEPVKKPGDDKEPTIIELWESKQIAFDQPIKFLHRGKWIDGLLKGVTADGKFAMCQAIDSAEVRDVKPKEVRLAAVPLVGAGAGANEEP